MPPAELRIGCSSWTSEAWWGRVYPESLAEGERLARYAALFDTVEVDASYYRPPTPRMVRGWRAKTPPGFRFALKMSRELIDPHRPIDPERLAEFAATARLLEEKLGPVLLQFPPSFRPARGSAYLRELIEALDPSVRYAIELRDAGWYVPEGFPALASELRAREIALAWPYLTYLAVPFERTTDFAYLRFIGDHTTVPAEAHGELRVDRGPTIREWAVRLRARRDELRTAYVYFNNHFAGFAPASASRFREEMGLGAVDWRPPGPRDRQTRIDGPPWPRDPD